MFFGDQWFIWTFNSCHRFSKGLKSGLIEDHGRTVILFIWSHTVTDLDVCLGWLSCWKVNLRPWSRFYVNNCRLSSKILISSSDFIIPLIAINCPVPLELKWAQSIIKPPPCFDVGTVFFVEKATVFVPNLLYTIMLKKLSFCFITPWYLVPKVIFLKKCFGKIKPSNNVTVSEEEFIMVSFHTSHFYLNAIVLYKSLYWYALYSNF